MRWFYVYFILILSISFAGNIFGQSANIPDSIIINSIDQENYSYLQEFINAHGVDNNTGDNSLTLLSFAILQNKLPVVKFLLQNGADVNRVVNNMSPLMLCAVNERPEIAAHLIKNGARVDLYNTHRNTALLYSSRYGNINTLKVLTQNRANPFFKNFMGYNSLDYAQEYFKTEVSAFLRRYMARYAKGAYPSTYDGPHIEWNGFKGLRATYLINDSINEKIFTVKHRFRVNKSITFNGFIEDDTLSYTIYKPAPMDYEYHYTGVKNVFAVGDLHGSYDSLIKLLYNNNIIDLNLNWSFGDGHLVFMGDLFDRGDKVTELLWLVYKLWNQAPQSNGRVHILLGNHELLIMNKDYRYVHEKYNYLTRGLNIDLENLYSTHTILGNFIRSFKVAVNIDSVLFVHAGLTEYFANKKISIETLNKSVYNILNRKDNDILSEQTLSVFTEAVSDKGPFWYRGYVTESILIPRATQAEIETVLNFYRAKTMVIGHTEVLNIDVRFNGKLIPINVPFDRVGIVKQGLKIINGKFFRCNSNGSEQIIM